MSKIRLEHEVIFHLQNNQGVFNFPKIEVIFHLQKIKVVFPILKIEIVFRYKKMEVVFHLVNKIEVQEW